MTQEEIVNSIYKAYGTDSGIVFGIKDRSIVETIVQFTIDRSESRSDVYDEGYSAGYENGVEAAQNQE